MALSTARMHRVRGRPPLLAAGINSLIHSHSSSVRSLGYIFSLIYLFYTTPEDFSDRLSDSQRQPPGSSPQSPPHRVRPLQGGLTWPSSSPRSRPPCLAVVVKRICSNAVFL